MSTPRTQRGSIARKMWMVTRENGAYVSVGKTQRECGYSDAYPVAVLDLREEAVEKMVEAVARAIGRCDYMHPSDAKPYTEAARSVLQAILPLRRGRGGK